MQFRQDQLVLDPDEGQANMENAMRITLTEKDFSRLQPRTIADILALVQGNVNEEVAELEALEWGNPVDLSFNQVQHFMETVSDSVLSGLQYLADHGPIVHGNDLLLNSDITSLRSFQGATTKRARNVTGVHGSTLLSWDDWNSEQYEDGVGRYGVTNVTFDALRRYFEIE